MTRINKDHQERLAEFLSTAQQLFFQKGYEKTTVNDIIDTMGVAKGTFYHYFSSKKDLLDKLSEHFSQQALVVMEKIRQKTGLNAVEKLNIAFKSIGDLKIENMELMKLIMHTIYNDENLLMRHKMFKKSIRLLGPVYAEILKQGMEEGFFRPVDETETAEMIFTLGINLNETIVHLLLEIERKPANAGIIKKKIDIYERTVERILGAEEGSLRIVNTRLMKTFGID